MYIHTHSSTFIHICFGPSIFQKVIVFKYCKTTQARERPESAKGKITAGWPVGPGSQIPKSLLFHSQISHVKEKKSTKKEKRKRKKEMSLWIKPSTPNRSPRRHV
jgi:hypothetical protein